MIGNGCQDRGVPTPSTDARQSAPGGGARIAAPKLTGRVLFVQHCPQMGGSAVSGLVTVRSLQRLGLTVEAAFGDSGPFVAEYAAAGCPARVVPHNNCLRPGGVLRSARRWMRERGPCHAFRQLIRDGDYDLVYVNTLVSMAAAVAARRSGVPCVWHVRELFDDVGGEMVVPPLGGRWLVRSLLRRCADHVIVNSAAVAENILGRASDGAVSVIPNSVDDALFESVADRQAARRHLRLPENSPIIGVPGTLRPMKGHPFFMRAASRVAAERPDVVYAISGSGDPEYEQQLRRMVGELGLTQSAVFCGRVDDMRAFYAASDLICIPSRAEPFGRVAIEALAAGKPVVATAVGGLREILDDGRTGILVPYADENRLSETLLSLLDDETHRVALGKAGREQAWSHYRETQYAEAVSRVVASCLNRRAGDSWGPVQQRDV